MNEGKDPYRNSVDPYPDEVKEKIKESFMVRHRVKAGILFLTMILTGVPLIIGALNGSIVGGATASIIFIAIGLIVLCGFFLADYPMKVLVKKKVNVKVGALIVLVLLSSTASIGALNDPFHGWFTFGIVLSTITTLIGIGISMSESFFEVNTERPLKKNIKSLHHEMGELRHEIDRLNHWILVHNKDRRNIKGVLTLNWREKNLGTE